MLGRRRTNDVAPPDPRELPPPVAELDRQLLDELRRVGADLAEPRDTRFFLYFATEEDADAAAETLAELDFEVEVRPREQGAHDERWRVVASRDMVVDEPEIARVRKQLGDVAVRNWGNLGGWEAEVQL
jgi:hypothetical protein